MKRFWSEVAVDADGGIRLDARPVNTPGRQPLRLPSPALAVAIADEWRAVGERIDPRAMPLTGLANAAIDRVLPEPDRFAADLARYGETDLLCYRAEPGPLAERQAATWDPLLAWARGRYDVHFAVTAGVMPVAQPPATVARLTEAIIARDPFALTALSPLVTLGGSLVIALAVADGDVSAEDGWAAATLDEVWQAELWGEDQEAVAARADRWRMFAAGARFAALVSESGRG